MKKGIITTFLFVFLFSALGFSQWVNQGAFPDASVQGQLHGVAVDPAGKIWAANFPAERFLPPGATDSITVRLIRVFNPDGSPAPFSPIWKLTIAGVTDTLLASNSRGMRADHNGNILYVDAGQRMYRINYQTGAGMNKVALAIGTSPTAPAVSQDGKIFVGPVVNANNPIKEFDVNFNYVGEVKKLSETGFSRTLEVSKDGNTIYFPIYTRKIIIVYKRPDELSAFDSVGTIMDGISCESMAFNKTTGNLWASGGSFLDPPDTLSAFTTNTWYEYNLATKTVVSSFKWTFTVPNSPDERPRAIDFSPSGNIAYVGCFGSAGVPLIQKFTKTTGVDEQGQVVVNGYKLSQNYPNPFNPSTKISFELPMSGYTTLKVYDMLGREVAVLVDKEMTSGYHSVNFNAANLASGTYIYQLNVNGTRITNKMVLLK